MAKSIRTTVKKAQTTTKRVKEEINKKVEPKKTVKKSEPKVNTTSGKTTKPVQVSGSLQFKLTSEQVNKILTLLGV